MVGRISWGALSGDEVEHVVSIYLCRLRPDTIRIRPSRGDNGIDLLSPNPDGSYDVYQVKKFATNLNNSQKRQIKQSWETVCGYCSEENLNVHTWYLVMPLDPTPEEMTWFNELTNNSGPFDSTGWEGLSHIEDWASRMPEVGDYYLDGGKRYVMNSAKELLEAANLPNLQEPDSLLEHLQSLGKMLDDRDPNYAYSVHVISKYATGSTGLHPTFSGIKWLMYSTTIEDADGRKIQVDVSAKYKEAPSLAPIQQRILLRTSNAEQKDELRQFIDFGEPISSMPAELVDSSAFITSSSSSKNCTISIRSLPVADPRNMLLVSENGIELVITQTDLSHGRRGFRWRGTDETQCVRLSMDSDGTKNVTLTYTFNPGNLIGRPVHAVAEAADFLVSISDCATFDLRTMDEDLPIGSVNVADENIDLPLDWLQKTVEIARNLSTIEKHNHYASEFLYPEQVSNQDARQWDRAAKLLNGETITYPWKSIRFTLDKQQPSLEFPMLIRVANRLKVSVNGNDYRLGYYRMDGVAGGIKPSDGHAGEYEIYPPEDHRDCTVQLIKGTRGMRKMIGRIAVAENPEISNASKE